jgi:hypothetical protein
MDRRLQQIRQSTGNPAGSITQSGYRNQLRQVMPASRIQPQPLGLRMGIPYKSDQSTRQAAIPHMFIPIWHRSKFLN